MAARDRSVPRADVGILYTWDRPSVVLFRSIMVSAWNHWSFSQTDGLARELLGHRRAGTVLSAA